jgi:hypothetical protein
MTRRVNEQAKGILMGQTGINADDAFRLISQRSQKTNRKISEIAQAIVDKASHINGQDTHALFAARTVRTFLVPSGRVTGRRPVMLNTQRCATSASP